MKINFNKLVKLNKIYRLPTIGIKTVRNCKSNVAGIAYSPKKTLFLKKNC